MEIQWTVKTFAQVFKRMIANRDKDAAGA